MSKDVKKQTQPDLPEAEYKQEWPQEKNFKYLKKVKDPRFGEVTLLKNHQNGEVIFSKEKMANSKKEATADITQLKGRMGLNAPNMLKMLGYSTQIEKQLCSTSYISKAFYEYPQYDMKKEEIEHKKNLTDFTSGELQNCKS